MAVSYITYKGKKILYADFRGMKTTEEMIQNLDLEVKFFKEAPGKLLVLTDMRNIYLNSEFMDKAKKCGKEVFSSRTEKTAILGVVGIKKILLRTYNLFSGDKLMPFDTEEEAKDYLVS